MAGVSTVSFMSQSMQQSSRLADLRNRMDDLQRQATTQKKYADFSGFGTQGLNVQRLRTSVTMTESYLGNITTVTNRMSMMNTVMTKISELGNQLIGQINVNDPDNLASVNQIARQNLDFIEELVNQQLDGQYLFAGSDYKTAPFQDHNTLSANHLNAINDWLADAAPTADATLFNTIDNFTTTQLGLSNSLATSGNLTAHIDQAIDIDYTVRADLPAFKHIIGALTFLANMKVPDPGAGDVATTAQLQNVMSHSVTVLSQGIQEMNAATQSLASKFNLAKSIQDNHNSDLAVIKLQVDTLENADPTTAIIGLQTLQTQLTASYQVANIVSQMSLVNYLRL